MTDQIKVFCSHNSVDIPRVKAVAEQLAAAGIDPWWISGRSRRVTTSSPASTGACRSARWA